MAADHISLDIETLGTKPGSVIASIGAVIFDPKAGVQSAEELLGNSTKIVIDVNDSIDKGMLLSGDTIKWWMKQSDEARKATFFANPVLMVSAGQQLFEFVRKANKPFVWGNGANFDITLLEAFLDKVQLNYPWHYTKVRCLRTLRAVAPFSYDDMPKNNLAHDCLADAIYQAQNIQLIAEKNPTLVFDK